MKNLQVPIPDDLMAKLKSEAALADEKLKDFVVKALSRSVSYTFNEVLADSKPKSEILSAEVSK